VQRATTTGTLSALDVDDDLVARQMCGQCTAIAVGRFLCRRLSAGSAASLAASALAALCSASSRIRCNCSRSSLPDRRPWRWRGKRWISCHGGMATGSAVRDT
jgi:hypothetical protein